MNEVEIDVATYIFILLLLIVVVVRWRLKNMKGHFFDFGEYNLFMGSILFTIAAVFLANTYFKAPVFQSAAQKLAFAKKLDRHDLKIEATEKLALLHPDDPQLQYECVQAIYEDEDNTRQNKELEKYRTKVADKMSYHYFKLSLSDLDPFHKSGCLGLAAISFYKKDYDGAMVWVDKVEDEHYKYVNLIRGKCQWAHGMIKAADSSFLAEMANKGAVREAVENLAGLYLEPGMRQDKAFEKLNSSPLYSKMIPLESRQIWALQRNDSLTYFQCLFKRVFGALNIYVLIAALLITLVWVAFMSKLHPLGRLPYRYTLLMLAAGAAATFPAIYLYNILEYKLGITSTGNIRNDAFYAFAVVGGIEEGLKILPFLLLLYFSKACREPIDYILYACLAACGFAFLENLIYFSHGYSAWSISLRALLCTVGHMCFSAIIAYGLVISRFRKQGRPWLNFIIFFVVAAFFHGLYDLLILQKDVPASPILSVLVWMLSIFLFSIILNNAINNSESFKTGPKLRPARLTAFLLSGLLGIYLFEYMANAWLSGSAYANKEFLPAAKFLFILLFFTGRRLGDIRPAYGKWMQLGHFFTGQRSMYLDTAVGLHISISKLNHASPLDAFVPITGSIVKRVKMGDIDDYYLLALDEPFELNGRLYRFLFIQTNDSYVVPESNAKIPIDLMLSPQQAPEELPQHETELEKVATGVID